MQSHLTVSYGTQGPAATTGSGSLANSAEKPQTPLGFLEALIDHLLAGGTPTADTSGAAQTASTDTSTSVDAPGVVTAQTTDTTSLSAQPQGVPLLAALNKALDALKSQLDAGGTPDPKLLKKLGDIANAIAALIAVPNQFATPVTASADTSATAAMGSSASSTPLPADQAALLLASLGTTAGTSADASDTAAGPKQPLPGIDALATKLADLSATLANAAPQTAAQLKGLSDKLATAETNPQTLAQLTTSTDTTGTALDSAIQDLLGTSKPTTSATVQLTPQIAAPQLAVPEAIAGTKTKASAIADANATTDTTATTGAKSSDGDTSQTAPTLKVAAAASTSTSSDDKSKLDTKIAAAVVADATVDTAKADPTATAQPTAIAAAVTAPTAVARALPAAYQAAANPVVNMGQVAFEMVRQFNQGSSRFSIRLDPAELGRIDVKMHVDSSGTVNARLTVERSETLDMFQRDKGALEKALNQAGLDSGKTNLEFSLKQNPFANMSGGDQRQSGAATAGRFSLARQDDDSTAVPAVTLYRGVASAGGVNLFV